MSYLLSPKVDFVFKKIFGNENNTKVLISFLNAVIKPDDLIKYVKIKNTDIEKEHIDDKYSRLDIKATTDKGENINVEIQVKNEFNMIKRTLYYWNKMYEGQIEQGDNYNKLERTICINILDFKYLKCDNYHSEYRLKETKTNEQLTDLMELHFIEIPKLRELDENEEVSDMLEAWISFIKNPESRVVDKLEMSVDEIKLAKDELSKMSANSKERDRYEKRKEAMLERNSSLEMAEENGIKKGMIKVALNSIKNGLEDNLIASLTNLSIEEIKELRKNNKN